MSPSEKTFLASLTALAQMCGFTLTSDVIAMYDENLREFGYEKLVNALKHVMINRRSRDGFPSIRDIRDIIRPEISDEDQAALISGRIMGAIAGIGPYQQESARASLGPIAWRVVEMEGGWMHLCEAVTNDNAHIYKAQWRNLARAVARSEAMVSGPALPSSDRPKGLRHIGNIASGIESKSANARAPVEGGQ